MPKDKRRLIALVWALDCSGRPLSSGPCEGLESRARPLLMGVRWGCRQVKEVAIQKEGEIGALWKHRRDQETLVWEDLCEAARRLGLEVRQEALPDEARVQGGLVRVGSQRVFLVEDRLPQARKNQILAEALGDCGVDGIYLPPYLRELVESRAGTSTGAHSQEKK